MNFAIIVAAGKSKRMGDVSKIFIPLIGKPLIYYTLKVFQNCSSIDKIIIVVQKKDFRKIEEIKKQYNFNKIKHVVEGGKERQDSVYNGFMSIKNAKNSDIIIVHNGSNPLVKENEVVGCINAAKKFGAAVCCFRLKDTIKKIKNDFIEKTIDRRGIYQMQTPQAIKYDLFFEGFNYINKNKLKITDDVSVAEALGKKIKIVECSYENIKITTQDDLRIAEGILMSKKIENFLDTKNQTNVSEFDELTRKSQDFLAKRNNLGANFRVGFGHDSHHFSRDKNKKLILGGCIIPNETGLEGNSDADVIFHALFNAISSAIGDRSLSYYSDSMCREGVTDSKRYLEIMLKKLKESNWSVNNISVSIEAGKPKLEYYTDKIKDSLAKILNIEKERIGLTYTSGEKLTLFGQGKGIQCICVVTLK